MADWIHTVCSYIPCVKWEIRLYTCRFLIINNGNWTEWSAIWSEIMRVISKSNECAAQVWFEITSMISDQNCMTPSSIATLLHPFWNHTIKYKNYQNHKSCQIRQTMAFLSFIFLQCDWLVKKSLEIWLVVLFYCLILIG